MSSPSSKSWPLVENARRARLDDKGRARIRAGLDARIALAAAGAAGAATLTAKTATAAAATSAAATAATAATTGGTTAATAGASIAPAAATAAKLGLFGGFLTKIVFACMVVGAVGLGARVLQQSSKGAPASAPVATPTAVEQTSTANAPAATEPSTPAPTATEAADAPDEPAPQATAEASDSARPKATAAPRKPHDAVSIAAEVALLREAQAALKEGDGARSLSALDALASKHPDGALREERDAARINALCAAGRADDARAAANAFLARYPKSVQAPHVRASCAFTTPRSTK